MYKPTALRPCLRWISAMRRPASSNASFHETGEKAVPSRRCGSRMRSGSSCTSTMGAALGQMCPWLKGSSSSPRTLLTVVPSISTERPQTASQSMQVCSLVVIGGRAYHPEAACARLLVGADLLAELVQGVVRLVLGLLGCR